MASRSIEEHHPRAAGAIVLRAYRAGDEPALHAIFHSAIHTLGPAHYTAQQLEAWSPADSDRMSWQRRMQSLRPFVVEQEGCPVAYADVQADGCIDHFFVAGPHARQGLGSLLMCHLHTVARHRGLASLHAEVSLAAQPFFTRFGFAIVEQRLPMVRGVVLSNALMRKALLDGPG